MKKKFLILLLAVLVLFSSCDLMMMHDEVKPKMYLVVAGLGYEGLSGTALMNPLHDTRGMVSQFVELCKAAGNEYEIVWYSDDLAWAESGITSTGRFTFTHYNDKSNKKTGPAIPLTTTEGMITLDQLENDFFSTIDSLWDEAPTKDDLMLFYFSGHGVDSLDNPDVAGPALFYTAEMITDLHGSTKPYINNYLAMNFDRIFRNMDKYPCRQLFIIDCCYSGASIENNGKNLIRDDNELGYSLSFTENYDGNARNDLYAHVNVDLFMNDSWNHTFGGVYGKPKRMVINASTYTQQSMNFDSDKHDVSIRNYGGFTYRLLKYLGYNFADDPKDSSACMPNSLKGKVVTTSSMMQGVYNGISPWLRKRSTPNCTRSSYDMVIWDFR